MHAIVFQVDMKEGREEKEVREELDQLIGFVETLPGFVGGTWVNDGRRGLSLVVFESEEAARNVAAGASMPPTRPSPSGRWTSTRSGARPRGEPLTGSAHEPVAPETPTGRDPA